MDEQPYYSGGADPLRGGRELPERGEVVRIVCGELRGEEAMVEEVGRDGSRSSRRTFVRLRLWGFPWPVEEPAYAVARFTPPLTRGVQRSDR